MYTEAQKRAKRRYDDKTVQFIFRFNPIHDGDIIEKLSNVPVKIDYIRGLIRDDMKGE